MQAHADLYKRALQYSLADSISACRALRKHLQQKKTEYEHCEKLLVEGMTRTVAFQKADAQICNALKDELHDTQNWAEGMERENKRLQEDNKCWEAETLTLRQEAIAKDLQISDLQHRLTAVPDQESSLMQPDSPPLRKKRSRDRSEVDAKADSSPSKKAKCEAGSCCPTPIPETPGAAPGRDPRMSRSSQV